MRFNKNQSDATGNDSNRTFRRESRGLGPFSGGQLTIVIGMLVAGLVFGVPAIASAVIPNGNTYNACASKASGTLRVIDTSKKQKCKSTETKLSWSKTGAKGAQGPQGVQGIHGVAGNPSAPLTSGQSESGTFWVTDGYSSGSPQFMETTLVFARPVSDPSEGLNTELIRPGEVTTDECPSEGQAAAGWLCVYVRSDFDVVYGGASVTYPSPYLGGVAYFAQSGGGYAYTSGTFTITAP